MKKKFLFSLIPLIALWLTALTAATIFDLDISLAIADRHSVYGRLFEIIGEPPAILFASFNFALLAAYQLRITPLSAKNKVLSVIFAVLSVGTAFYTSFRTYDYVIKWFDDLNISFRLDLIFLCLTGLAAVIISAVFIMLALTMSEQCLRNIYHIAKSCVKAAVLTFVTIWALKLIWGRVRFRDLGGNLTRFTPWYVLRGYTGNFSFPSGHTANATVIFTATHYLRLLDKKMKPVKGICYALSLIWIAVVAFSRVCVGAHFLSDVLFGMAITFAIIYFTKPKKEL